MPVNPDEMTEGEGVFRILLALISVFQWPTTGLPGGMGPDAALHLIFLFMLLLFGFG